ncbi:MAG: hypothetical protein IPH35_18675 [Rhodoferax sp.]|nr:hypothetical protein [Rhodoferax sp.]
MIGSVKESRDLLLLKSMYPEQVRKFFEAGLTGQFEPSVKLIAVQIQQRYSTLKTSGWTLEKTADLLKYPHQDQLVDIVGRKYFETANLLLDAGAKLNMSKGALLTMALFKNDAAIWKWIFGRSDFVFPQEHLDSAFRGIIRKGDAIGPVVEMFLQRGANINQTLDDGKSLIVKIAEDRNSDVVTLFMKRKPVLPDCYANAEIAAAKWDFQKVDYWRQIALTLGVANTARGKSLVALVIKERKAEQKHQEQQRYLAEQRRQEEARQAALQQVESDTNTLNDHLLK